MKSTGETTNTTEKEQKLPVTEKNGTAPEKTEHILNRLIIGAGVCVAVIAVLILPPLRFRQKNGFRLKRSLPISVSVRRAYR